MLNNYLQIRDAEGIVDVFFTSGSPMETTRVPQHQHIGSFVVVCQLMTLKCLLSKDVKSHSTNAGVRSLVNKNILTVSI